MDAEKQKESHPLDPSISQQKRHDIPLVLMRDFPWSEMAWHQIFKIASYLPLPVVHLRCQSRSQFSPRLAEIELLPVLWQNNYSKPDTLSNYSHNSTPACACSLCRRNNRSAKRRHVSVERI